MMNCIKRAIHIEKSQMALMEKWKADPRSTLLEQNQDLASLIQCLDTYDSDKDEVAQWWEQKPAIMQLIHELSETPTIEALSGAPYIYDAHFISLIDRATKLLKPLEEK